MKQSHCIKIVFKKVKKENVIEKPKNENIIEKPKFIDKDLEFNAPKTINLKNLENYDKNELEKWFEEDHSNINENLYAKKKKKKIFRIQKRK